MIYSPESSVSTHPQIAYWSNNQQIYGVPLPLYENTQSRTCKSLFQIINLWKDMNENVHIFDVWSSHNKNETYISVILRKEYDFKFKPCFSRKPTLRYLEDLDLTSSSLNNFGINMNVYWDFLDQHPVTLMLFWLPQTIPKSCFPTNSCPFTFGHFSRRIILKLYLYVYSICPSLVVDKWCWWKSRSRCQKKTSDLERERNAAQSSRISFDLIQETLAKCL